MLTYSEMKTALKDSGENTKYFTKEFYDTFLAETRDSLEYYSKTGTFLPLEECESSDFYKENGGAWCVMLELDNASKPKFRVDICEGDYPHIALKDRVYTRNENENEARMWADGYCKAKGYTDAAVEFMKVAEPERVAQQKNNKEHER